MNEVGALTVAIDKFKSSWLFASAGLPTPRVRLAQNLEDATRALFELGDAVLKPVFGSLGIGIERLRRDDRAQLAERLQRHRALYLQEMVLGVERDVRAFVVGDRVAAAVSRRPISGEFRGNASLGAATEPLELGARRGEAGGGRFSAASSASTIRASICCSRATARSSSK